MKVTQQKIARRVGLDVSSVNKILNKREGPVFRQETIDRVFSTASKLGYNFGKLKFYHRRRHARRPVNIPAKISILGRTGTIINQGEAVIRDLSLCGVFLTDVTLTNGGLPTEPFTVVVRPRAKALENVELSGRVIRLGDKGAAHFGVSFFPLPETAAQRLRRFTPRT